MTEKGREGKGGSLTTLGWWNCSDNYKSIIYDFRELSERYRRIFRKLSENFTKSQWHVIRGLFVNSNRVLNNLKMWEGHQSFQGMWLFPSGGVWNPPINTLLQSFESVADMLKEDNLIMSRNWWSKSETKVKAPTHLLAQVSDSFILCQNVAK